MSASKHLLRSVTERGPSKTENLEISDPFQSPTKKSASSMSRSGAYISAPHIAPATVPADHLTTFSAMRLRRLYQREANSHRNALRRAVRDGITFADDIHEFRAFLAYILSTKDFGRHPGGNATLDRIDGKRGYEKGNIRWANKRDQARNRGNVPVMRWHGGKSLPVFAVADKRGLDRAMVRKRLSRGWTAEEATALAPGARRKTAPHATAPASTTAPPPKPRKRSTPPLPQTVRPAWEQAWRSAFPLAPGPLPWTKKERGQMATLAHWLSLGEIDPCDFIRFVVSRWRWLGPEKFAWMRDPPPPAFPTVGSGSV